MRKISSDLKREDDAIAHRLIMYGLIGYQDDSQPKNHGYPWSQKELILLKEEYSKGLSIEEIAKNHRRQRDAILHNLISLRLIDFSDRNILEKFRDYDSKADLDKPLKEILPKAIFIEQHFHGDVIHGPKIDGDIASGNIKKVNITDSVVQRANIVTEDKKSDRE